MLAERLAIDFHDFELGWGGYKYPMLVTDRSTGLIWDFYLADRKSRTIINSLSYLLDFLKQHYNLVPKVVECDNELTTQKPKIFRFLQGRRIKVQPSAPYTHNPKMVVLSARGV